MDPTTALVNALNALADATSREVVFPGSEGKHRAAEHMIALGEWLAGGGWAPKVEVWIEGPGFVCFKVSR